MAPADHASPVAPPPTRRQDLVETIHGVEVPDPYRWLEEDSPEVKTWVAAQNRHTRRVLDGLPQRAAIRERLLPLLRATTTSSPQVARDRVFTVDRGGDRDQAGLCVRSAAEQGPANVVVDPATISGGIAVEVYVNSIKLKEVGQVSPDVVAGAIEPPCQVTLADATSFTTPLATSTYGFCFDLNSDGGVTLSDAILFTPPASNAATCN